MAQKQDIQSSIGYLLVQMCKAHHMRMDAVMRQLGLMAGQDAFILSLWSNDGLTPSQLADQLRVQPATISNMLNRLQKAGFIARKPDLDDHRVTRIHLTEQGQQLSAALQNLWNDLEQDITDGLTPEERLLFRRLILHVYANISKRPID